MQISNYKSIISNIIYRGKELSELAEQAVLELNKSKISSEIIEKGLNIWKNEGMSSDIYNSFVNAGLTDEKLSTLREIIDNPQYKIEILNAPSTFRTLVNSTIKLIDEVRIKKPPEF